MKKLVSIILVVAFVVFGGVAVVSADTINPRPFSPELGDLSPLQAVFSGIGSSINVYNDQSAAAIFEPTGTGSSSAAFIAQVSWDQTLPDAGLEFGLYEYGNSANKVTVIPKLSSPTTAVTIYFDFNAGTVTTRYAVSGIQIDTANFTRPFGFYTQTDWNNTGFLYSEDSLNPGGEAQQLIYAAKGDDVTFPGGISANDVGHWYVAAEALDIPANANYIQGGFDFNDMVVQLESVKPVPEPTTLMLLGLGLLGLGIVRRKK